MTPWWHHDPSVLDADRSLARHLPFTIRTHYGRRLTVLLSLRIGKVVLIVLDGILFPLSFNTVILFTLPSLLSVPFYASVGFAVLDVPKRQAWLLLAIAFESLTDLICSLAGWVSLAGENNPWLLSITCLTLLVPPLILFTSSITLYISMFTERPVHRGSAPPRIDDLYVDEDFDDATEPLVVAFRQLLTTRQSHDLRPNRHQVEPQNGEGGEGDQAIKDQVVDGTIPPDPYHDFPSTGEASTAPRTDSSRGLPSPERQDTNPISDIDNKLCLLSSLVSSDCQTLIAILTTLDHDLRNLTLAALLDEPADELTKVLSGCSADVRDSVIALSSPKVVQELQTEANNVGLEIDLLSTPSDEPPQPSILDFLHAMGRHDSGLIFPQHKIDRRRRALLLLIKLLFNLADLGVSASTFSVKRNW